MRNKLLNFYEAMRDSIFLFIVYTIVCIVLFMIGGAMMRFPHIFKFLGVLLMVGAVYLFTYFPTITKNNK